LQIDNCRLKIAERVPVYILAGGRSRRFGSDKARALLQGKPLILHVAEALRPFASSITAVADTAGKYDDFGLRTIADLRPGLGPLGGLASALAHCGESWLLLTACDLPGIAQPWIETLLSANRDTRQVVAFRSDRWQPMPALYHQSITALVGEQIQRDRLAFQCLLDRASSAAQPLPHDWPATAGVNTPQELEGFAV